jgi:hypothetical protein
MVIPVCKEFCFHHVAGIIVIAVSQQVLSLDCLIPVLRVTAISRFISGSGL